MNRKEIKALREKRENLCQLNEADWKRAADEEREVTDEENEVIDRRLDAADKLKEQIDRMERSLKLRDGLDELEERLTDGAAETRTDTERQTPEQREEHQKRYREAYHRFHRVGLGRLTREEREILETGRNADMPDELRAQSTSTDSEGGFDVPDDDMREVELALQAFGGVREVATIITTDTGRQIPWPTVDDTGQTGVRVAQNASLQTQDVTFAQLVLDAYEYSSKIVPVAFAFLQDSNDNFPTLLRESNGGPGILTRRVADIQNVEFTTGTGSSQPNGIVTAAADSGITAASATTYTYDELLEVEHAVDPAYRRGPGTGWMFNDTTLKAIRKIKDGNSLPIWTRSVVVGEPDNIDGYPYTINQAMASPATTAKSVLFGKLSKYHVRQVRGATISRSDHVYFATHQAAFVLVSRADGELIDAGTNPVVWADHT